MLSRKWTPMNHRCTKLNEIYNKLVSDKQSGANDFDLFTATKEQYASKWVMFFSMKKHGRCCDPI